MAEPTVATNRDEAADVLGGLATKVTFDHVTILENLGDGRNVVLTQITCLQRRIDLGALADALRSGRANAVEVRQ